MNMIKGGYKVIDLSDIALSSVPYEIPGIYAKIQKSFEKAILISNLNIDGAQQQDYFCQPVKTAGGDFTLTVGDYTLTITSSDNVSVAEGIIGGGGSGETYTAGDNIQINNGVISATDTTYSAMTGASASTAGTSGLVPAPAAGDEDKALCGDGTYHTMSSGSSEPIIKIGGAITNSTAYTAFNSQTFKYGVVSSTQHDIKLNCPTDLASLIGTSSTASDSMCKVKVQGSIYPGTSVSNAAYIDGMAYIYQTSSQYTVYVKATCARSSGMMQNVYFNFNIAKSSMADPTKFILTDYKIGTLNYSTVTYTIDVGIETYPLSYIDVEQDGYFSSDISTLVSYISSEKKIFVNYFYCSAGGLIVTPLSAAAAITGTDQVPDPDYPGDYITVYNITMIIGPYVIKIFYDTTEEKYVYQV